jgi:hypothetical protein
MVPLTISDAVLDEGLDIIEASLRAIGCLKRSSGGETRRRVDRRSGPPIGIGRAASANACVLSCPANPGVAGLRRRS